MIADFERRFQTTTLVSTLLMCSGMAGAQVRVPVAAKGLCNSGLTPKAVLPTGCRASVPVAPVNPYYGGPSVDGNWELASPYPSAPYNASAPNPCTLVTPYGSAWVDAADGSWYNPIDQLSQWITPLNDFDAAPGWYIYRTGFLVPTAEPGYSNFLFEVSGQILSDNQTASIFLKDDAGALSSCREVDVINNSEQFGGWTSFHFSASVIPVTHGYLYFVVYNAGTVVNPTGLRLEFSNSYFYPY